MSINESTSSQVKLPSRLSPSRIKDFVQCPKLFHFKLLGLSTPPTEATTKGTLAHHVFERIFDHPREERTVEIALEYLKPAWEMMLNPLIENNRVTNQKEIRLRDEARAWSHLHETGSDSAIRQQREADEYRSLISPEAEQTFLDGVESCIRGWFMMENPVKFDPMEREFYVASEIAGVNVHGYIDRLDRIETKTGPRYYISDYKTGKPPGDRFQDEAFFQLAVYALLVEKQLGVRPYQLRLIYVREGRPNAVLTRSVSPALMAETKRKISSVWRDIQRAASEETWEPRKQTLCGWCFFQSVCPAYEPELSTLTRQEIAERTGARLL